MAEYHGNGEYETLRNFEEGRRLFAIRDGTLHIAKIGIAWSHSMWFDLMRWTLEMRVDPEERFVHGTVERDGVYFSRNRVYVPTVNEEIEHIFFPHLRELSDRLAIDPQLNVFGGTKTSVIKEYGAIQEILAEQPQ